MRSRALRWLVLTALAVACASPVESGRGDRRVSVTLSSAASVAARNTLSGPYVSVLDSVDLRINDGANREVSHTGARLTRYQKSVPLVVEVPEGQLHFVLQVLSVATIPVFSGTAGRKIPQDGLQVDITGSAISPVMAVLPDTLRTNGPSIGTFTTYNVGRDRLDWTVGVLDTALARCGRSCSIVPNSGSVDAGASLPLSIRVPPSFPSRTFVIVLHSAQGDVPIVRQYGAPVVTSVNVSPAIALVAVDTTVSFRVTVASTGDATVTWSSTLPSVAAVSASGVAIGRSSGTAYVRAVSNVNQLKSDSALVHVYSGPSNSGWVMSLPGKQDTVHRDATVGFIADQLVARISGKSGTFVNPFQTVEFWGREIHGQTWVFIGNGNVSVTDDGTTRTYFYSLTWNPTPTDASFPNPSITRMELIAIGVASNGSVVASPVDTLLTIQVP
jgi:hypothetical protein